MIYISHRRSYFFILSVLSSLLLMAGCKSANNGDDEDAVSDVITPVTVTTISQQPMADTLELNATSSYLLKSFIKSNATGYLHIDDVHPGQMVERGRMLFSVRTKEATALGNSINSLDSSFHFSGINNIRANITGFITQLDHQPGDYVLDGEELAVIAATNSFVFLMDMPYELRPFVINKRNLDLVLPDGEKLNGVIDRTMPIMDSATQTQRIVLRVNPKHSIPENLIAKVKIVRDQNLSAITLPKPAVLADETQTEFWVMKMINDSTAAKVPVTTGVQTNDRIEILSPRFSDQDRILVTGNFGLPDTAKVSVTNK